jgi:Zn-dependent protease with chaperone function
MKRRTFSACPSFELTKGKIMATGSLTENNLIHPREGTYFTVLLVFSCLLWLCCVFFILALPFVALTVWCIHGLLIARLRSESVRITPEQYPELHATFVEVCQKLQLAVVPELYVLQSGGFLNAFATRFTGRNFVVIYSSLEEILGASGPMMKFLMGHEIGHIQRKHLIKKMVLIPGLIVPLLYQAYHRACESTCDRHGAYASDDLNGSMQALTVLASGRAAARVDTGHFAVQHFNARGFFVSWHELASTYPTLSQRVAQILGFQDPQYAARPERHPLAYPCAFIFNIRNIFLAYLAFIVLMTLGASASGVQKAIAEQQRQMLLLQQQQQQQQAPETPPATK